MKFSKKIVVAVMLVSGVASYGVPINSEQAIGIFDGNSSALAIEGPRLDAFITWHNTGTLTPATGDSASEYAKITYVGPALGVPPFPARGAADSGQNQVQNGGGTFPIDVTGYLYLMAKWSDKSVYYYLGGLSGLYTLENDLVLNDNNRPKGLSHYRLFGTQQNQVPDGGVSAVMLGLALLGLGALRLRS